MSRKYKFHNPDGLYFVSFVTVYWLDIFVRDMYCCEIVENLDQLHNNPVEAGFVLKPWHWKYSSAIDYAGGEGVLKIDKLG